MPDVQQLIRESGLTERHARALLSVQDAEKQRNVAWQTVKLRLTPQETEALAAKAAGIMNVLVPTENLPDVSELEEEVTKGMTIIPVERMDDVLAQALEEVSA